MRKRLRKLEIESGFKDDEEEVEAEDSEEEEEDDEVEMEAVMNTDELMAKHPVDFSENPFEVPPKH